MKTLPSRRRLVILAVVVLMLAAFGCNLSDLESKAPPTPDAFATVYAQMTLDAQADLPSQTPAPPLEATPTVAPASPTAEVSGPAESPRYRGFMVVNGARFTAFDFDANRLGFDADASGIEWLGESNTSVFAGGLAYSRFEDGGVTVVTESGRSLLDFIRSSDSISAQVSPDGSQIAWAYQLWDGAVPASEVWMANMDGSQQRKLAEISAAENADRWLVYHIVGWTADGRVLFATQPTGIGGYILYGGWNGMEVFDPASGVGSVLVDDSEMLGLSLNGVSDDLRQAAISSEGIRVRTLSSGVEVALPLQGDQNVCGSGKFSPSGVWLAYGCGRNNPENEAGQIMLAPVDGSSRPQVLYNDSANAPRVLGWLDEETILFQTYDAFGSGVASIWKIQRDGTRATRLLEGFFLGFIPAGE